jgi:hypothetical protein
MCHLSWWLIMVPPLNQSRNCLQYCKINVDHERDTWLSKVLLAFGNVIPTPFSSKQSCIPYPNTCWNTPGRWYVKINRAQKILVASYIIANHVFPRICYGQVRHASNGSKFQLSFCCLLLNSELWDENEWMIYLILCIKSTLFVCISNIHVPCSLPCIACRISRLCLHNAVPRHSLHRSFGSIPISLNGLSNA